MIRIIKQQTLILKPDPNENPADPKRPRLILPCLCLESVVMEHIPSTE